MHIDVILKATLKGQMTYVKGVYPFWGRGVGVGGGGRNGWSWGAVGKICKSLHLKLPWAQFQ